MQGNRVRFILTRRVTTEMTAFDAHPAADGMAAWLGDAKAALDADAGWLDRFAGVWNDVADRYGDDKQQEATAALTAAVRYLLGEADERDIGRELMSARVGLAEAMAAARQVAMMATEDGATEVDLARDLGVDRARTLRRWLGKA
jgi:hypothetical protein